MEAKLLQRDRLSQLVDALVQDYEVIAPKDDLSYGRIHSAGDLNVQSTPPTQSLKTFFFAQSEALFEYRSTANGVEIIAPSSVDTLRVIFGARPCDAASLPILDKLFTWDFDDGSYLHQRERTVIVSLACEQPPKACFCVSVGGSPAGTEGADVLLTPLDDAYHVSVLTEKGEALVGKYAEFFQDSSEQHDQKRASVEAQLQTMVTKQLDVDRLAKALAFDGPVWETLTQQCVDCAICTFLCPTCHCFDIQDEGDSAGGSRVRLWDSCARQDFTRMPVHQPRPTHHRRYRQRLMHKFKYYPENFGRFLCVGCGRCTRHCPVGVDITKALEAAAE